MILPSFHWSKHIGWHGWNSSTRLVGGTSDTQTPCELHSILRINPYKWTFPNCNISFIMDQSTNKTTNEWLLQVAYGKTCPTLGALLFTWQQNHNVGCMKSKDRHTVGRSCLFWSSVFESFFNFGFTQQSKADESISVTFLFLKEHSHKVKSKFWRWTNFHQHKLCLEVFRPHHMGEIRPFCLPLLLGLMHR